MIGQDVFENIAPKALCKAIWKCHHLLWCLWSIPHFQRLLHIYLLYWCHIYQLFGTRRGWYHFSFQVRLVIISIFFPKQLTNHKLFFCTSQVDKDDFQAMCMNFSGITMKWSTAFRIYTCCFLSLIHFLIRMLCIVNYL